MRFAVCYFRGQPPIVDMWLHHTEGSEILGWVYIISVIR